MEAMSGLDAAFLSMESETAHLHVAAVMILEPPGKRLLFSPAARFTQFKRLVAERIHLAPPLRKRALRMPFGLHHPVWVDDPAFDLDFHVRRASLPTPGGDAELAEFVADTASRTLDPARPLWEMHVVEGLPDDRVAVVAKVHHAILDGVSGAELLAGFLDLGPTPRQVPPAEPWDPPPLPGYVDLALHAAGGLARHAEVARDVLTRAVDTMLEVSGRNRKLADVGESPPPSPFSAPRTSLNGTISAHRRYAMAAVPLKELRRIGTKAGVTVNDVVLSVVGTALGRRLAERGDEVDGPLVAFVPLSTRGPADAGKLGNKVSGMLVPITADGADPIERLAAVARMANLAKDQSTSLSGQLVDDVAFMALPALLGRATRMASNLRVFDRTRPPFNVTVSNVRGPEFPLWCGGSKVAALYPLGPIMDGVGLNVTVMSYRGTVHFGVLGCRRLAPDVADVAELIRLAVGELSQLAPLESPPGEVAGAAG